MNNLKDAAIYLDAIAEYRRLCDLIGGRPPFGDCELVALLVYRAVSADTKKIVRGWIEFEDERTEHFWVEVDGEILDPLSDDFIRPVISWLPVEKPYSPEQIVRDLEEFLADFPYPCPGSPFPLRWKVRL